MLLTSMSLSLSFSVSLSLSQKSLKTYPQVKATMSPAHCYAERCKAKKIVAQTFSYPGNIIFFDCKMGKSNVIELFLRIM